MYEEFKKIGRDCFLSGLISSHGGNMSVRIGDRLVITRRNSMLGNLARSDLIETGIVQDDSAAALASTELIVHRAIYTRTGAQAVLHTHPAHGVVLSLNRDEIIPIDSEGIYLLDRIPIVAAQNPIGSEETADLLSHALIVRKVCMLRGHGLFATGRTLEDAYHWTSAFESSARVLYLARLAGIEPLSLRRPQ